MASNQSFVAIPELVVPKREVGLESRNLLEQLEELYGVLNEQANQIDTWREEVIRVLLQPLVDDDEGVERTGEEFLESTQMQEKLMVYVLILKAVIADRQDAILGQTNELIRHEMDMAAMNAQNGLSPAPELFLDLSKIREELKPGPMAVSVRGVISSLRHLKNRYSKDDANERYALEGHIAEIQMQAIQKQSTEQTKTANGLKLELERFTSAMNARLEYYRQLQALSDSVLPYEGPTSEEVMRNMLVSEGKIREKLSTAEAKHRYRKYRRPLRATALPIRGWELMKRYSHQSQGVWFEVERAQDMRDLPNDVHRGSPHDLRSPVLPGLYEALVPSPSQLSCLQDSPQPVQPARYRPETTRITGTLRCGYRGSKRGRGPWTEARSSATSDLLRF